jgi:hypothetical protein
MRQKVLSTVGSLKLFKAVITDSHFLVPLGVLLVGLILLMLVR